MVGYNEPIPALQPPWGPFLYPDFQLFLITQVTLFTPKARVSDSSNVSSGNLTQDHTWNFGFRDSLERKRCGHHETNRLPAIHPLLSNGGRHINLFACSLLANRWGHSTFLRALLLPDMYLKSPLKACCQRYQNPHLQRFQQVCGTHSGVTRSFAPWTRRCTQFPL